MDRDDILNRFTYHPPKGDASDTDRYVRIRGEALALAETINELCPEGREKSLAVTNLEQAVMWANASIARAVRLT